MAGQKFWALVNGFLQGITSVQVGGAGSENKIASLDATGRWDISTMPIGVGAELDNVLLSESVSQGDLINFWTDTGNVIKARKADASSNKKCSGFAMEAGSASATIKIGRPSQSITGLTSLIPGSDYFLDSTAGKITNTPLNTSGYISQYIGNAKSATELTFTPGDVYII